jgi:hypothetical protein
MPAATRDAAAARSPTTTTTSRPACRSRHPIEVPMRPPPITTTSAVEEIRAELIGTV